ncbi:amino acid ABC transporter permease [Tenggerimyces flavus]|uniref:Amino acid ABC transporter permease n=1 Tax=Tenggerimyces flavus TaxID=1708749 RepID=A0ABV7YCY4_9ACTN|nr:amino acid ABC transporter permease [Tenggerimyces flavus]MBM7787000.1 glutamate transport system permease protein [Tenggerimyces flavus]
MNVLIDKLPQILAAFGTTLQLLGASALIATILGVVLGAFRVSPVPALRWFGTAYVTIFRNTPLVVVFIIFVVALPELGFQSSFFFRAVIALSLYAAAFVCEAVRSGVNAVQAGQAEAARSLGMTFSQTLRHVVLPQAIRTVIPPLASIYIALAKNTAVAEAFGVTEATYQLDNLVRDFPGSLWFLFFGIALGYVIIVFFISGIAGLLERRWAVSR